jgi:hypothetical protein
MKNQRGIVAETLLVYVLAGVILFFVPNTFSSSLGLGIRPNKTIQTEKVELIRDAQGNPMAYKTTTSDRDIQQRVGFWEWLRSLPIFVLFLMGLGVIFPGVATVLAVLYSKLKTGVKQIITGVEEAKKTMSKESTDILETNLSKKMDTDAKATVKKIKVKL